jgi:hypothetical protein
LTIALECCSSGSMSFFGCLLLVDVVAVAVAVAVAAVVVVH